MAMSIEHPRIATLTCYLTHPLQSAQKLTNTSKTFVKDLTGLVLECVNQGPSLKKVREFCSHHPAVALSALLPIYGCASIPLTPNERSEYVESITKYPETMEMYTKSMADCGRVPIGIKKTCQEDVDSCLGQHLVKTRRGFTFGERFWKGITGQKILREDLEIRTLRY